MKKILLIALILLLTSVSYTNAHPGRTASDDCHYCRTNCDSWGVAWNERHCHGGYTTPVVVPQTNTPTYTQEPALTPYLTNTPTPTAMPIPTSTPTPISQSDSKQEVAGASTQSNDNIGLMVLSLIMLSGLLGGIYLKNKKDKNNLPSDYKVL
mgnify:CR=1 FL=1